MPTRAGSRLCRAPCWLLLAAAGCLKVVYLAPARALVQEKVRDWAERFGRLGVTCREMTGVRGTQAWECSLTCNLNLCWPTHLQEASGRSALPVKHPGVNHKWHCLKLCRR